MSRRQRMERRERRKQHSQSKGLRTRQSLITGATVTAGALVGFSSTAAAADFQVDNLGDSGFDSLCTSDPNDCSLRGAVSAADSGGDAIDNITFQSGLSGQITLTGGEIPILTGMYFLGPGASTLRISGDNSSRIFYIDEGTPGTPVGIYNLSLMYGHATGVGYARDGGAIYNKDAFLKVVSSVMAKNSADANGGAIFDKGDYNHGHSDYIVASTFSNNTAVLRGGGLYGFYSLGTIESSTISGNHTTDTTDANGGGGVASYDGTSIHDSTVANNTSGNIGGGVWVGTSGAPDQLKNTIVADNSAGNGDPDTRGTFDSQFSLIENPGAAAINTTVAGSNLTGVDPQLQGLSDNGGPTPTQVPAVTSPAIDRGQRNGAPTDQRGLGRPFDIPTIPNSAAAGADGSDIGAVELQAGELPSNAFTLGKVKGKTLPVSVSVPGSVSVVDAATPLSAAAAKTKKLLKPSSASGGPPTISVKLLLTKLGNQKLREKGKVTVNARITFTPNRGIPKTVTQKLKIKSKRKK